MGGRDRGSGVRNRRPDGHQGDRRHRRGHLRGALEAVPRIATANSDRRGAAPAPRSRVTLDLIRDDRARVGGATLGVRWCASTAAGEGSGMTNYVRMYRWGFTP